MIIILLDLWGSTDSSLAHKSSLDKFRALLPSHTSWSLYVPLIIEFPLRWDVATAKHRSRMMNFVILISVPLSLLSGYIFYSSKLSFGHTQPALNDESSTQYDINLIQDTPQHSTLWSEFTLASLSPTSLARDFRNKLFSANRKTFLNFKLTELVYSVIYFTNLLFI